jgi:hypothetical protein
MLFHNNLAEIVFGRHLLVQTDELVIVSGYVGPAPIARLQSLPLMTTVVYGMYGAEGIRPQLHASLTAHHAPNVNVSILYSRSRVHSKCYAWKFRGAIVHALVGSANFSSNGLSTPDEEILAETTVDTFEPLNAYINSIVANSIECTAGVASRAPLVRSTPNRTTDYCRVTLLDPRTGEVQRAHGLNWGQNPANHTNLNDANIPIRADHLRLYPELFPPKQAAPVRFKGVGRAQRHNDKIEIIWDDGTTMEGLLEGTYEIAGIAYPKQISSFPDKQTLGAYIRNRLRVRSGGMVTREHLERYGRTHLDISLQSPGIYLFDFSVPPLAP